MLLLSLAHVALAGTTTVLVVRASQAQAGIQAQVHLAQAGLAVTQALAATVHQAGINYVVC